MWPSLYLGTPLESSVLHARVLSLARQLLGEDMEFDFDMLISKEGGSLVETPWHQDESYWLDLPDKVIYLVQEFPCFTVFIRELYHSGFRWLVPR